MCFLPTEKPTKLWCSISKSIVSRETTNLVKSSSGLVVNCGSILQNPKTLFPLSFNTILEQRQKLEDGKKLAVYVFCP